MPQVETVTMAKNEIMDFPIVSCSSDMDGSGGSVKYVGLVYCIAGLLHLSCKVVKFYPVSSMLYR